MSTLVVHESHRGNTRQVAEAIAEVGRLPGSAAHARAWGRALAVRTR